MGASVGAAVAGGSVSWTNSVWAGRGAQPIRGEMLAKLTMAAKRLNVLIIFVAHPKKPQEKGKAPTMYDISGSADWYNMADYGIIIHRERKDDGTLENSMRVIVEKVKDFQLGNPAGGEVHLIFNRTNYKLEEND